AARFFLQQGERAPDSDGALFAPRPLRAAVHGAWGMAERRKAGGLGMALLGAVAVAAGMASWLLSGGRRNGREQARLGAKR
ncbi:hypothetical protein, partial [uncultured Azohydromonas sp.]|uniref:hypothetical protein n=1 Tax=uncultured Azohydromonas sp. TaxID=487342 RepID=UPI00260FC7E3